MYEMRFACGGGRLLAAATCRLTLSRPLYAPRVAIMGRWSQTRGYAAADGTESPLPIPDGSAAKTYDPKIVGIVDEISKLTLLETADLNELLKKTLKIADAPVMAMGAVAAAPAEEEEAAVKEEKTEFVVKFEKVDPASKVKAIREIKNMMENMNLVEAKKFVEGLPKVLKESASKEEAEALKAKLEAIGGTVVIE